MTESRHIPLPCDAEEPEPSLAKPNPPPRIKQRRAHIVDEHGNRWQVVVDQEVRQHPVTLDGFDQCGRRLTPVKRSILQRLMFWR